jgi:hypothetical protein
LRRIHSAFELPAERFGFFELTDQQGGERLDRIPLEKNGIGIAERACMQPERIAPLFAGVWSPSKSRHKPLKPRAARHAGRRKKADIGSPEIPLSRPTG